MEKGFFKVFTPNSLFELKIPTAFVDHKNGKLPRKVSLRDWFGNMWPIGVAKTGRDFYFKYEWEKFIEDNTLEFGDFFVFDYDGNGVFDFKLFGKNGCEKKGEGGLKLVVKEEEMNVEHHIHEEPKEERSGDSSSSSFDDSDEDDEEYMVEEEEEEIEVEEENEWETTMSKKKESRSKGKRVKKEEDDDEETEEKEGEETENARRSKHKQVEEEVENERAGILKKKATRLKAGCKRSTAGKKGDFHDYFGKDIFESGHSTKPKNPHFLTKIRPKRSDQLYVPCDVVRDNKLKLPPSMTIRDSAGRKFETKRKNWKDGRIWLVGGWRNLCKWNLVGKDDNCICEFVKGEGNEGLYLQVQVLYEGASSHPNMK